MKNIFFLFHALIFVNFSVAATFNVTSNTDSGPGSLRQAIIDAAANGTTSADLIQFNLSVSATQIVLLSRLPQLSSNLTIDGTSQPGTSYGVSDARIEIVLDWLSTDIERAFTIIDCMGIRIYGVKIVSKVLSPPLGTIDVTAFYIRNSSDVEIGNVGKGTWYKASRM